MNILQHPGGIWISSMNLWYIIMKTSHKIKFVPSLNTSLDVSNNTSIVLPGDLPGGFSESREAAGQACNLKNVLKVSQTSQKLCVRHCDEAELCSLKMFETTERKTDCVAVVLL